mmetsp:Transcript_38860/g.47055  ORF Transcript_38860/g.47055 Transcript_38860/m.47055 type:complete len:97 (+) Transcript_38860:44-334(+)
MQADTAEAQSQEAQAAQIRRTFNAQLGARLEKMQLPEVLKAINIGGAESSNIRKAYRVALLKYHPDRQQGADLQTKIHAEEIFKIINRKMDSYHAD